MNGGGGLASRRGTLRGEKEKKCSLFVSHGRLPHGRLLHLHLLHLPGWNGHRAKTVSRSTHSDTQACRNSLGHKQSYGTGRSSTTIQETSERKATAQGLQQLPRWRGLAVTHDALPIIGRVAPWSERPQVRKAIEATAHREET